MKKSIQYLNYLFFRLLTSLLSLLPHRLLWKMGKTFGLIAYYLHTEFRKKSLTNLQLAFPNLPENERVKIAKGSFQNLMITTLEFAWFKNNRKKLLDLVVKEGGEKIIELLNNKKGVIFLSAHQGNWEIPFLAMTDLYAGTAIGRPIKNPFIYRYVIGMREMNLGRIVMPRRALREGVETLKRGHFFGIVGDQAYLESDYYYPLFGLRAWTSTLPALLSIRTKCPLVVAQTKRVGEKYHLSASDPIYPNLDSPVKEETERLMNEAMAILEKSIQKQPEDWLWQHDRFKQKLKAVKRKYRFGSILITLPKDPTPFLSALTTLRQIYEECFLTLFVPENSPIQLPQATILTYKEEKDLFVRDFRYQMVIDFYDSKSLRRHFHALAAFETLNVSKIKKIAGLQNLDLALKKTLLK